MIVDFYCSALYLAIEVDGESHFSLEAGAYDQRREKALAQYGVGILRFTNSEVEEDMQTVLKAIESVIASRQSQIS